MSNRPFFIACGFTVTGSLCASGRTRSAADVSSVACEGSDDSSGPVGSETQNQEVVAKPLEHDEADLSHAEDEWSLLAVWRKTSSHIATANADNLFNIHEHGGSSTPLQLNCRLSASQEVESSFRDEYLRVCGERSLNSLCPTQSNRKSSPCIAGPQDCRMECAAYSGPGCASLAASAQAGHHDPPASAMIPTLSHSSISLPGPFKGGAVGATLTKVNAGASTRQVLRSLTCPCFSV
jgi:hypothetical protein